MKSPSNQDHTDDIPGGRTDKPVQKLVHGLFARQCATKESKRLHLKKGITIQTSTAKILDRAADYLSNLIAQKQEEKIVELSKVAKAGNAAPLNEIKHSCALIISSLIIATGFERLGVKVPSLGKIVIVKEHPIFVSVKAELVVLGNVIGEENIDDILTSVTKSHKKYQTPWIIGL